jgi:hypothetical protein
MIAYLEVVSLRGGSNLGSFRRQDFSPRKKPASFFVLRAVVFTPRSSGEGKRGVVTPASQSNSKVAPRVNAKLFTRYFHPHVIASSCDCPRRYHRSWTLILTPIQVFAVLANLLFVPPSTIPASPTPNDLQYEVSHARRSNFIVVPHIANLIPGCKGLWNGASKRRAAKKDLNSTTGV